MGAQSSNANEPGDTGRSPGKSSLYFMRNQTSLEWARPAKGMLVTQSTVLPTVSGVLPLVLENPGEAVQLSCQAVPISARLRPALNSQLRTGMDQGNLTV